jgi:hypothetical protein
MWGGHRARQNKLTNVSAQVRDAAALRGCGFLGLGGFSFWVLSSVEKKTLDVLGSAAGKRGLLELREVDVGAEGSGG